VFELSYIVSKILTILHLFMILCSSFVISFLCYIDVSLRI